MGTTGEAGSGPGHMQLYYYCTVTVANELATRNPQSTIVHPRGLNRTATDVTTPAYDAARREDYAKHNAAGTLLSLFFG